MSKNLYVDDTSYSFAEMSDLGIGVNTYGVIGQNYPEEINSAKRIDSTQMANRLRFVHVTDTHEWNATPFYDADEFTDLSSAKFMAHTGDLVNDNISNSVANTINAINAMAKPCYICMGNHDVWRDTSPTQRYTKYFNQIATHNGLADNISYYSVDFSTEKVKCIWLDLYELSTGTPTFKMSQTQIEWFLGQLDDAITNTLHVCIFLHQPIAPLVDPVEPFYDGNPLTSAESKLIWIADVVKAFQTGTSVTFTHESVEYSHTFSGHGVFIAYFNGHIHTDAVGKLSGYDQYNVTCTRFKSNGEKCMIYRAEKLGICFNYVAIDTARRWLSVIRMGNENTICGIKRDAFNVIY